MNTSFDLTLSKTFSASPETVFNAWLDPEALARFMCPGDVTCARVEVDAQVSGSFLIMMKAGDKEMPHRGEYRIIDPHRCLEFTWTSENTGADTQGKSVVTLTFEALGTSETKLNLRHVGLPSEASRKDHLGGWSTIVELLVSAIK